MTAKVTARSQVEQLIESRLQEIEEQLRPFTELMDQRRRLHDALDALRADAPGGPPIGTIAAARPTPPGGAWPSVDYRQARPARREPAGDHGVRDRESWEHGRRHRIGDGDLPGCGVQRHVADVIVRKARARAEVPRSGRLPTRSGGGLVRSLRGHRPAAEPSVVTVRAGTSCDGRRPRPSPTRR